MLARFVPIVRTFITVTAGVARMDPRRYFTYSLMGGVAWAAGVTVLGYFLGQFAFVRENIDLILMLIVLISVMPIVIEVLRSRRKNRSAGPATAGAPADVTGGASDLTQPISMPRDGGAPTGPGRDGAPTTGSPDATETAWITPVGAHDPAPGGAPQHAPRNARQSADGGSAGSRRTVPRRRTVAAPGRSRGRPVPPRPADPRPPVALPGPGRVAHVRPSGDGLPVAVALRAGRRAPVGRSTTSHQARVPDLRGSAVACPAPTRPPRTGFGVLARDMSRARAPVTRATWAPAIEPGPGTYQASVRSACWRIQACMATPAATPTLIERVEPNWAIDTAASAAARAASDRPGPS